MAKAKPKSKSNLPVPVAEKPEVPWTAKSKGERLSALVDQSLEQTGRILGIKFDPEDRSPAGLKLVSIVANTALTIIAQQARLDEAALRTTRNDFDYGEFYERFGATDEDDEGDEEP